MNPIRIKRLSSGTDTPRLPEIGRLRKGSEKGANAPGRDLEGYFRFTSKFGTDVEADFYRIYGKEPRRIPFRFPYRTMDENYSEATELWKAGRLIERGDGETAFQWRDEKTGEMHFEPKPQSNPLDSKGRQMRGDVMRMTMMLPDLLEAGRFGTVSIASTSSHDIVNIRERMMAFELMSGGDLRGIDFILTRVQGDVTTPDGKTYKKWLLEITIDPRYMLLQLQAQHYNAYQALAAGPTIIDHDTGEIKSLPSSATAIEGDLFDDEDDFENEEVDEEAFRFERLGKATYGQFWGGKVKAAFEKKQDRVDLVEKRLHAITDADSLAEHLAKIMPEYTKVLPEWITLIIGDNPFDATTAIGIITTATEPSQSELERLIAEYADGMTPF